MGYIRSGTYYIDRTVVGRRLRVSTGCTTREGAMAELRKFEVNPGGYRTPRGRLAFARKPSLGTSDPVRAAQLRENHHRRTVALSPEEYQRRFVEQEGSCAICGALAAEQRHGVLDVDHCHRTGVVRGLLCNACNRGIGALGDSAALLRKAADYLDAAGRDGYVTFEEKEPDSGGPETASGGPFPSKTARSASGPGGC